MRRQRFGRNQRQSIHRYELSPSRVHGEHPHTKCPLVPIPTPWRNPLLRTPVFVRRAGCPRPRRRRLIDWRADRWSILRVIEVCPAGALADHGRPCARPPRDGAGRRECAPTRGSRGAVSSFLTASARSWGRRSRRQRDYSARCSAEQRPAASVGLRYDRHRQQPARTALCSFLACRSVPCFMPLARRRAGWRAWQSR